MIFVRVFRKKLNKVMFFFLNKQTKKKNKCNILINNVLSGVFSGDENMKNRKLCSEKLSNHIVVGFVFFVILTV